MLGNIRLGTFSGTCTSGADTVCRKDARTLAQVALAGVVVQGLLSGDMRAPT
jgi:hypothetical protein